VKKLLFILHHPLANAFGATTLINVGLKCLSVIGTASYSGYRNTLGSIPGYLEVMSFGGDATLIKVNPRSKLGGNSVAIFRRCRRAIAGSNYVGLEIKLRLSV
jgi:hypothetical protein